MARGEHDRGGARLLRELACDLEPVEVREVHVEQDDVGAEPVRRLDRRVPVLGLAHDHVAVELEDAPGAAAEAGVVVDDEDRGHVPIDSERRPGCIYG